MTHTDRLNKKPVDESSGSFAKISPTAKLVAYFRKFSDIPFATDVSRIIGAKDLTKKLCPDEAMLADLTKFAAPALEARYKSMLSAVKKTGINQVLELASGLSFRGLLMTDDPSIIYVESDLSELTEEKKKIIQQVERMGQAMDRPNLFLEPANALSLQDLQIVTRHFDHRKPIAIIHEGLYMYLSRTEKETLADNIRQLLQTCGGLWLTPDFILDEEFAKILDHPKAAAMMTHMTKVITDLTGRNLQQDQFKDESDLHGFFERAGFKIKATPQIDGTYQLSSLDKAKMSTEQQDLLREALRLWILELNFQPSSETRESGLLV